jgi:DNA-binding MarR family transcriptional regulator
MNHITWLSDLVRLEIALWNRVDATLKQAHNLPLASLEALFFIAGAPDGSMRVGDLAQALKITVGAASKLVDRVEAAGLLRRELDASDRRASRVVLTAAGSSTLAEASATHGAALASVLDAALSAGEQQRLHALVVRLLAATTQGDRP